MTKMAEMMLAQAVREDPGTGMMHQIAGYGRTGGNIPHPGEVLERISVLSRSAVGSSGGAVRQVAAK